MAIQQRHRFRLIVGTVAELTAVNKVYRITDRILAEDTGDIYFGNGVDPFADLVPLATQAPAP